MSAATTLTIKKISPAIGAVVQEIDLSQPLSRQLAAEIEEALAENLVLFFEEQHSLTPETHRAFAQNFGKLRTHPYFHNLSDRGLPELIVLDNHVNNPPDNDRWHTDVAYVRRPPMGCVLRALQLPSCGGDTCWSSTIAAYNGLSKPFQKFLDGLTATHDFSKSFSVERWANGLQEIERQLIANTPPVMHPLIRVHPVTGRKGIFIGRPATTAIDDLTKQEGDTIYRLLAEQIAKPEYTVRWHWKEGDVAFWDNRLTQHYALADYLPERRIMHRATIIGDMPFGPKQP